MIHPGVVSEADPSSVLSLADLLPLPAEEAAGVVASLAATVGDLHDLGMVAVDLSVDTVVLDPGGRPMLIRQPVALISPMDAVDDVRSLGRLLSTLLPEAPARRSAAAKLSRIAQRAVAASETGPSPRQVADAIGARVPGARLPGGAAVGITRPGGDQRRPPVPLLIAAAVLVVLTVAVLLRPGGNGDTALDRPAAGSPTTVTMTEMSEVPAAPAKTCPAAGTPGPMLGDVDGDGCDESITYADGQLITNAGRFTLGATGDRVVTGRWTCGAPATVAILRRDGRLFVADRWATAGGDVVTRLVATQPGAIDVRAIDRDGDGCDELVLARGDGSSTTIVPGRSR